MAASTIHQGRVVENMPVKLIGRAAADSGSGDLSPDETEGFLLEQTDVQSIQVKVFNNSDAPPTLVSTVDLVVVDSLFDELQEDGIWKTIDGGGNLQVLLPATCFPAGNIDYRAEAILLLQDGTQAVGIWDLPATELFSSGIALDSPLGLTPGSILFVGASGEVAEDNAKLFYDDATNCVGLGTTAPTGVIHVIMPNNKTPVIECDNNTSPGWNNIHYFTSGSRLAGASTTFQRAGGTIAAHTPALSGWSLGHIYARGFGSATTSYAAAGISFFASANISPTSSPGKIHFWTQPPGSSSISSVVDRVIIDELGSVCLCAAGNLLTTATQGFTYLPACAGTPTGVPVTIAGIPCVLDTVGEKLWARFASGWKSIPFA